MTLSLRAVLILGNPDFPRYAIARNPVSENSEPDEIVFFWTGKDRDPWVLDIGEALKYHSYSEAFAEIWKLTQNQLLT